MKISGPNSWLSDGIPKRVMKQINKKETKSILIAYYVNA